MDITPTQIAIIQEILKNNLPSDSKVWLFGSRATKAKKAFSDLDLAIDSKKVLPLAVISSLEHAFSESDLPYKVDIVDLNNINKSFRSKITTEMVFFWRGSSLGN